MGSEMCIRDSLQPAAAGGGAARGVPAAADWRECGHERLRTHYARELAAEAASPEALRTTRVLPTLFVPCCPKAGTTFLNLCVARAFHPAVVCRNPDPHAWAGPACANRSFVLGGVRANPAGLFHEVKEPFYFNKETAKAVPGAARDLAVLAGPPLPLCTWWLPRMGAPLHASPINSERKTRAFWNALGARVRVPCNLSGTPPPHGTRPPAAGYFPPSAWPGCRLNPPDVGGARGRSDFVDYVAFKVAFPLAAELPAGRARTYDMTPNYLCSSHAMRLVRERYGPQLAARARFIVMLREPVSRAFSEFSMFRTWGWEKVADFGEAVSAEIAALRQCLRNDTLLLRPLTIAAMPPADVVQSVMRCGSGDARQYVRNSLYESCVAGAYAHFERSQFMFIFAEDLREMSGGQLMLKIEAFTRLTLVKDAAGQPAPSLAGRCDTGAASGPGGTRALPNHQTRGRIPPPLKAALRRFFAPSRAALASLVRGSFDDAQPLARLEAFARDDAGAGGGAGGTAGDVRDVASFGVDLSVRPWERPRSAPAGARRPPRARARAAPAV